MVKSCLSKLKIREDAKKQAKSQKMRKRNDTSLKQSAASIKIFPLTVNTNYIYECKNESSRARNCEVAAHLSCKA